MELMMMKNRLTLLFVVSVGCLWLVGCFANQAGRRQLLLVSEGKMNTLGAQTYAQMKKKNKLSNNAAMTTKIRSIGMAIARASGKPYKWEFTLFDSKELNAWCLPGGKVGVYTGILPVAKTNAGLAAIMGHEVAHATLKHGAERVSQQMASKAGLTLAALLTKGSKHQGLVMGALGIGGKFGVLLPYSRKHESEADSIGLQYMAKAGFDPRAAVTLWQRMAKAGAGRTPELLSTHPDPIKRSKAIQRQLPKVMPTYNRSRKIPTKPL